MVAAKMAYGKAINPDLLDKYLDAPRSAMSAQRFKVAYNSSCSWNGLSVDPRPFSRLDTRYVATGTRNHALGLAGTRVIELESSPTGESMCCTRAATAPLWTPIVTDCKPTDVNLASRAKFENLHVVPSKIINGANYWRKISAIKALCTPSQRLEALELEVAAHRALAVERRTFGQSRRLVALMRARHPDGVLGSDSMANPHLRGDGGAAGRKAEIEAQDRRHADKRRDNIARHTASVGYAPFQRDPTFVTAQKQSYIQARACHPPYADTHLRIFQKREVVFNPDRTQRLRDYDLNGKHYNIVTHATIGILPPKSEAKVDMRLQHPSQQSLERGRNLQGSLLQEIKTRS